MDQGQAEISTVAEDKDYRLMMELLERIADLRLSGNHSCVGGTDIGVQYRFSQTASSRRMTDLLFHGEKLGQKAKQ